MYATGGSAERSPSPEEESDSIGSSLLYVAESGGGSSPPPHWIIANVKNKTTPVVPNIHPNDLDMRWICKGGHTHTNTQRDADETAFAKEKKKRGMLLKVLKKVTWTDRTKTYTLIRTFLGFSSSHQEFPRGYIDIISQIYPRFPLIVNFTFVTSNHHAQKGVACSQIDQEVLSVCQCLYTDVQSTALFENHV